ncbi:sugar lactone lactonase YvrE [Bradyrhizobium sp. F1.13.1]
MDGFVERPSFGKSGNLYVVDIPFGRIFRISPDGAWSLIIEYDGWPNGLKIARDGRVLVADYMNGLMELDPQCSTIRPLLGHRNFESFRGCNDLHVSANADIYFTDQGQTGLHDPTGWVFRLCPDGRLGCLISNGASPTGLVLSPDETAASGACR